MVGKKTIGNIQLIIGIIVLVLGVVGIVTSIIWTKDLSSSFHEGTGFLEEQTRQECTECSEPEIEIIVLEKVNMKFSQMSFVMSPISNLGAVSILFILISLLFITQGLLNKSGNQNV